MDMQHPDLGLKASTGRRYVMEHFTSLALLVLGVGLWGFVELAGEVIEGDTHALDETILLAMRTPGNHGDPVGPAWVEEMFRDFTALGGIGVLTLVCAASVGFDRPRPDLVSHGSMVYTSSFPSGHSMLAAVVFLTCGAFLAATHARRRVRVYILGYAVLLSLLVGVSRVYLGVHWPTDVLAGWAAGSAWAAACWLLTRWLQARGRIECAVDSTDKRGKQ